MAALAALAPRQPAGDFAPVLENIQVPPAQGLGVIVTKDGPAIVRTSRRQPQTAPLLNLQINRPAFGLKPALTYLPFLT
jgi:hypothetical protein